MSDKIPLIMFDMDETLLHTLEDRKGPRTVLLNPQSVPSILRAKQVAKVIIYTAADMQYALEVLEETCLLSLVGKENVYATRLVKKKKQTMHNLFNIPWILIDDMENTEKVRSVYPQADNFTVHDLVEVVSSFEPGSESDLASATERAIAKVLSPGWGMRCPISGKLTKAGKETAKINPSNSYGELNFCCAGHKEDFIKGKYP